MDAHPVDLEVQHIHPGWGWLLVLGFLLMFLGTIAFFFVPAATIGTVIVLGWLIVISGVIEAIYAFSVRTWPGMFLHLIGGVLGVLLGFLIVTRPLSGALTLTLLVAAFLCAVGLLRLIVAISFRLPNWGWAALDGIIALAAGILLWLQLPWSGLWFLGLMLGFSLLFRGWAYVMLAIAVRSMQKKMG